jgi:glycosyltransferase involved in cell wall biosynthesis
MESEPTGKIEPSRLTEPISPIEPNRTIVILSTEPWGKMLLSKMHFALELVKKGNRVYFVNPPRLLQSRALAVPGETLEGGRLTIIHTNTVRGSLFLRHKLFFLYRRLNVRYIRAIRKITGGKIAEVWSFNPNQYVDLRPFDADRCVLMLYDFYRGAHIVEATRTADALISVSQVILDHYKDTAPPKLFIHHGLGLHFADRARWRLSDNELARAGKEGEGKDEVGKGEAGRDPIRVGYTGNLLRAGMNTEIAREIIGNHGEIEFHFWGPHSTVDNNVNSVGDTTPRELLEFVEFLKAKENVFLHGVVDQQELAERLFEMDAFLFLYSPRTEMNGASNSHKLLEYLSTGKVIIATHVSSYAGTDLLEMSDPTEEQRLPAIFDAVIRDPARYNSPEKQIARIRFALDNTYARQVERVQQFITRFTTR